MWGKKNCAGMNYKEGGWMDKWMYGCMEKLMDGQKNKFIYQFVNGWIVG